jgi:tripartite-type tricarboxylate transporter receptor subunit TctC
MTKSLGQSIVIENRPGASTAVGTLAVVRSRPDGHTILAADIAQAVAPLILKRPGFDPLKDLKPVGVTSRAMQTLAVTAKFPAMTVGDLVKLAKEKPDTVKVAHSGVGVPPHLTAIAFMEATGVKLSLVLYRGIAQGLNDVVGGHVDMLFTGSALTGNLAREGKLRILGVTGTKRLASLPDIPTLEEGGVKLKAMQEGNWFGIAAPAGTPDAIIAKLNAAVVAAGKEPAIVAHLDKLDIRVDTTSPDELGRLMKAEYDYWRETFKLFGVTP